MKLSHTVISGVIALCCVLPAQAALHTFAADLTGDAEVAPVVTPAFGTTMVVYDDALHTLTINIDFIGLMGATTAAHIHAPASPGMNAGVAVTPVTLPGFPAGVTSLADYEAVVDLTLLTSYTGAFRAGFGGSTAAGSEAAFFSFLQSGQAYVNVHTTSFPGGEIRGYLVQVPDTATTMYLLSVALGVVGLVARRSRFTA